jgi:hypothetical protein
VAGSTVLFVAGCASPKFFPVGIYGVPEDELSTVKKAGFNMVVATPTQGYLDFAERNGLKVLAVSGGNMPEGIRFDIPEARARSYDQHPALWGWYTFDEPDLHRIPPKYIQRLERTVERSARKKTVLVLSSAWSTSDYGHISDWVMVDYYPVPWGPVASFGREMRVARMARGNKPTGGIVQAFDWKDYPDLIDVSPDFRPPSYQEMRCMTFMAAAEKVDSLLYYVFQAREWDMRQQPETWEGLQRVVTEVNAKLGLFTGEHLWFSMQDEYPEGTRWNQISEEKITRRLIRVKHPSVGLIKGDYLLLINTTDQEVKYRFKISDVTKDPVRCADNLQTVMEKDGWADQQFAPYDVILIGPL